MFERVKKLVQRYQKIFRRFVFLLPQTYDSNLLTSSYFLAFQRASDKFAKTIGSYTQNKIRRSGLSYSDVERQNLEIGFKQKATAEAFRLASYKNLDVKLEVTRVEPKKRKGVTFYDDLTYKKREVRALKGLRTFSKQAEYVAAEMVHKTIADENNKKLSEKSPRFRWWTAQDERVRDPHKKLHGKIFRWDDLPIGADGRPTWPSREPGCRCEAKEV